MMHGRFAKWTSPFLKAQYIQNLSAHYRVDGEVAEESTKPIKVVSDPSFKKVLLRRQAVFTHDQWEAVMAARQLSVACKFSLITRRRWQDVSYMMLFM